MIKCSISSCAAHFGPEIECELAWQACSTSECVAHFSRPDSGDDVLAVVPRKIETIQRRLAAVIFIAYVQPRPNNSFIDAQSGLGATARVGSQTHGRKLLLLLVQAPPRGHRRLHILRVQCWHRLALTRPSCRYGSISVSGATTCCRLGLADSVPA